MSGSTLQEGIDRVEEEFEKINTEEYFLEKTKELQQSGTVWFKNELKELNANNKQDLQDFGKWIHDNEQYNEMCHSVRVETYLKYKAKKKRILQTTKS